MKAKEILIVVFALMVAGVSAAQVPPNDECSNAELVPGPTMTPIIGDTTTATSNMGDPVPSCASAGDGVWYYFTPLVGGETRINTCGSTYPNVAALDLYWWDPAGGACDSAYMFPEVFGCDAGQSLYCSGGSAITVTVVAGNTYYLHVFDPAPVSPGASGLRSGGSLNLNLGGSVPVELIEVKVD